MPSNGLGTPCLGSIETIRGSRRGANPPAWPVSFVALATTGTGSEGSGGWMITGYDIISARGVCVSVEEEEGGELGQLMLKNTLRGLTRLRAGWCVAPMR